MDLDISGPSSYISSLHSFTCLCRVGGTDKKSVLLQWEHQNWFWPWNLVFWWKIPRPYAAYVRQGTSILSIRGPNHEKGGSWSSNDAVWKLLATPSDQLTPKKMMLSIWTTLSFYFLVYAKLQIGANGSACPKRKSLIKSLATLYPGPSMSVMWLLRNERVIPAPSF